MYVGLQLDLMIDLIFCAVRLDTLICSIFVLMYGMTSLDFVLIESLK